MMPKIDGFEMVRRIRKTEKITPILFLTARSAINDVVKGFELGANDYLKKPFGMQELIVRIKALAKLTSFYQTIFNIFYMLLLLLSILYVFVFVAEYF